jgi:hypothetical protein
MLRARAGIREHARTRTNDVRTSAASTQGWELQGPSEENAQPQQRTQTQRTARTARRPTHAPSKSQQEIRERRVPRPGKNKGQRIPDAEACVLDRCQHLDLCRVAHALRGRHPLRRVRHEVACKSTPQTNT